MMKSQTISGINDSYKLTQQNIKLLRSCFKKVFSNKKSLLLCWGSVARNEMGPYSDLDIIVIEEKHNPDEITKFTKILKKTLKNRIDLLESYSLEDLYNIASVDATSRQAMLLARPICGNKILTKKFIKAQENIANEDYYNFRELIHTWMTMHSVSCNLTNQGIIDLKTGTGFLRYFNYLYLITKLDKGNVDNLVSTKDAIVKFSKFEFTDNNYQNIYLLNFDLLLSFRNFIQSTNENESNILNIESVYTISEKLKLTTSQIHKCLKDINRNNAIFEKIVFKILSEKSKTYIFNKEDMELFNILMDFRSKIYGPIEEKILSSESELLNILLAHRSSNYDILEKLRCKWIDNWYIIYGIANNQKTDSSTLFKLVQSSLEFSDKLRKLYNGFTWRNIRLSVSKNSKTDKKTLLYIINHENSRPMDILAARKNMLSREKY